MSLARKIVYSSRGFLTASYVVDGHGSLRPQRPSRCPFAVGVGDCAVSWYGWRCRKCGPGYPLAKGRCSVHEAVFTIYPPGWSPFGRRGAVAVSHAGFDIAGHPAGLDAWTTTAFGASSDAASGRVWPETRAGIIAWRGEHERDPYGVARTQRRHMAGVNALFALTPELSSEQATVVAAIVVNLSDIVQASGRVRDGPFWEAEGKKGAAILSILGAPRRHLLTGINRLGADRKYWGPPISAHHQPR
jgi:hypothetical protein